MVQIVWRAEAMMKVGQIEGRLEEMVFRVGQMVGGNEQMLRRGK